MFDKYKRHIITVGLSLALEGLLWKSKQLHIPDPTTAIVLFVPIYIAIVFAYMAGQDTK